VNSHEFLAHNLLEIAKKSSDPIVRLSALLRAIEEFALFKFNLPDHLMESQKLMVERIRDDKELYEAYTLVLDDIFNFLLGGEENPKVVEVVEEAIRRKGGTLS
jgi:hypothetical protein